MRGTREERMRELDALVPEWKPRTVWGLFSQAVQTSPDAEFLVFEDGRCYTYRQAMRESLKLAYALHDLGVRAGDHVAVKSATVPEAVFLGMALTGMRAVRVALNPALGSYELAYALRQSGARFLFTDGCVDFSEQDCVEGLEYVVSTMPERVAHARWSADIAVMDWDAFAHYPNNHGKALERRLAVAGQLCLEDGGDAPTLAHETCDVVFTSGSTGNPKGAMLSHDMLLRSAWANCLNRGFELGRRVFVPLPLFHVYAYVEGLLSALFVGGALLMPSTKLAPESTLAFMQREGANDLLAVPSLMMKYLQALEVRPMGFPQLHSVYCSASNCPDWIWGAIAQRFGVDDVITGYGMTEVAGASLQTRPGDSAELLATRVGAALPTGCAGAPIEYRVVSPETGAVMPEGSVGELECRGPVLMSGYCNDAEATRRAFTADGWFRTGDAGRFDAAGYLELSGRLKDSYKINGENVSTRFVEKIMGRHPAVEAVEVLGVPDDKLGAFGVVFVQLADDSEDGRATFERYCVQNLARYQVPKYYYFLGADDWPRTAVGKVEKAKLRRMALAGAKAGA